MSLTLAQEWDQLVAERDRLRDENATLRRERDEAVAGAAALRKAIESLAIPKDIVVTGTLCWCGQGRPCWGSPLCQVMTKILLAHDAGRKFLESAKEQAAEIARLKQNLDTWRRKDQDGAWHWVGDGNDHPESLVCPVLIRAEDFRKLLEERDRDKKRLVSAEAICESIAANIGPCSYRNIGCRQNAVVLCRSGMYGGLEAWCEHHQPKHVNAPVVFDLAAWRKTRDDAAKSVIKAWPVVTGFACRQCGDAARENPAHRGEWGCARCSGSSHSIALNFEARDDAAMDEG